jgi:hypothetical protein
MHLMVYYHISLFQRYGIFCIWIIVEASCAEISTGNLHDPQKLKQKLKEMAKKTKLCFPVQLLTTIGVRRGVSQGVNDGCRLFALRVGDP